ncbi:PPOX class F420-dependent oxidoreductase [Actinokineospora enzanensis]|uniref:PPOX class F420-dependent oxidoreductase n=1 Tax=Actinokineospora enzanensis TaxID=155975 RepID=UPI00037F46A8|nr:PPOX class F420-dependent oxidoreductase [Actinokineospora enzanensis]
MAWQELGDGKYLLVTTVKRDGTKVPTPLWVARDGDDLVVWTVRSSGKVKRIRNNPRIEVAPCDIRGNPAGASVPASARLLDEAGTARARKLIIRKYGLVGRILVWASRFRRGYDGTIGIAISPV